MSGPLIALTTFILVFAFAGLLIFSTQIFEWIFNAWKNGGLVLRLILLIPLVLAAVLFVVAWPIAIMLGIFAAYTVASGIRDWMHKGK